MSKILVVDNEIDLLRVIEIFLVRKSFEVKTIAKWQDISNAINTFKPDLILLDIQLNGADGRVICKQLKADKQTENIPILLYSANYRVKGTLSQFKADGFIEKPFEVSVLTNEISSILARYGKINS